MADNDQETSIPTIDTAEAVVEKHVPTEITPIPNTSQETSEDPNWRAFREARKKDRAEREAAERRAAEKESEVEALKAAMEAAFNKGNSGVDSRQSNGYQQYTQYDESEDERIEKKIQNAIALRDAAAEKARQQREQQEYPKKLADSYPDFNNIITAENLDYLEYHYPEISRPLKRLQDDFNKWEDIYKAVKRLVPNSSSYKKEAAKAHENFNKPKSMSSTHVTQMGQSSGNSSLSEQQKAANWARMQKSLKGIE